MPTPITRLHLENGTRIQVGEFWPGEETVQDDRGSVVTAHKVGVIIPREEVSTPGDEDAEGQVFMAAGVYEVWMMPDEMRQAVYDFFFTAYGRKQQPDDRKIQEAMKKYQNLPCREVHVSKVLFAEKSYSIYDAFQAWDAYFEGEFESVQKSPQTQVRPPINGPSQQP
jgi:hypothetical protein